MRSNVAPARSAPPSQPPSLLDNDQAAQFLGLGRRTLENWRVSGDGPPFLRVGRSVRYSPADLEAWLKERRFRSTAEADQVDAG